jgi:hypothetical protein
MVWVAKAELAVANDSVTSRLIRSTTTETRTAVGEIVSPLVATAIAQDGTIAAAASTAVGNNLATRRVAQYAPTDSTNVLGLSATGLAADTVIRASKIDDGNTNAYLIQTEAGQQLFRIRGDDGTVDALLSQWSIDYLADRVGGGGAEARWDGAITEWWCNMVCEDPKNNRVLIGCMSHEGIHYVLEARPGAAIRGVAVTSTPIADDHNLGGISILPDGSLTYVYNQHNQATNLYAILGDADGSVDSLAKNPVVTIPGGGSISYNQLTLIDKLSTATSAQVYVATRRNSDTWGMIKLTYNLTARTITPGSFQGFFSGDGQQSYTHVGPSFLNSAGQQVVPCATAYNPESSRRIKPDVYRYTINLDTGEIIYSPSGLKGQLGTATLYSAITPALNTLADDSSRRLFYNSRNVILYAEGLIASPDDWTYYAAFFNADGTYTRKSFGRAGKRVGYRADSNYLSGMTMRFSSEGTSICLAREAYGTYTVEVWKLQRDGTWTTTTLYNSTARQAVRPYWAGPMGWLFNEVISYPPDTYIGAEANVRFAVEGTQ